MIRKGICAFLGIFMFISVGCRNNFNSNENTEDFKKSVESIYFNNEFAMSIADKYMLAFKDGDLNTIKSLSTEEIDENIIIKPNGDVTVTGIKEEGVSQMGGKAMFKYEVTRAKEGEPKAYLEEYYLEVNKTPEEEYKVSMFKSVSKYNIFKEKEKLKIRKDDDVEINTLIELKNIPDRAYPKVNVIDIAKVDVPKDDFSALGLSFTGDKVAISTYSGNNSYIGVVDIEDSEATTAEEGQDEGEKNKGEDNGKTVGKKIVNLDIIEGAKIKSLNFSDDDGYVVVNYDKDNARRFKVYQSNGDIVALELDDIFSEASYNLVYEKIKDNNIVMEVTPLAGSTGIDTALTGKYKISLKDFKLQKL
ncbi:hypothetical protein [Clostridium sp. B9]|uniref:hypothetical protein n=1 Tax=Clostridium sp. B9 TaxID=3423224 RepID=UPI003D2EB24A